MLQRGYRLNQPNHTEKKLYRFKDLENMTTHQLREICRAEKIIKGVINTLDRDSLIQVIMRYRGLGDEQLINIFEPDGNDRLETLFTKSQLHHNNEYRLHGTTNKDGNATITVFSGIATVFSDGITMAYDSRFVGTNALVVNNNRKVCGIFNVMSLGSQGRNVFITGHSLGGNLAVMAYHEIINLGAATANQVIHVETFNAVGVSRTVANNIQSRGIPNRVIHHYFCCDFARHLSTHAAFGIGAFELVFVGTSTPPRSMRHLCIFPLPPFADFGVPVGRFDSHKIDRFSPLSVNSPEFRAAPPPPPVPGTTPPRP